MKILHTVESYYPAPGGMAEVVRQISERLARMGHSITVATSAHAARNELNLNGVTIIPFSISGAMTRSIQGEIANYQSFLLNGDFDVIVNFAAQHWATDLMLPLLGQISARKIFVPTGFSGLFQTEYQDYYKQMPEWMRQYDANIFLSETYRDRQFARQHNISNCFLISNGASEEEFLSKPETDIRNILGIDKDELLVLHVGSHTGLKGHYEAINIFKQSRLKNAVLLIIGNALEQGGCMKSCQRQEWLSRFSPLQQMRKKRVMIMELSRKETVAAYQAADLFLFPSRIECSPIVLFECAASKTPFLATPAGNTQEIIEWMGGGMLLPSQQNANGEVQAHISTSARMLEDVASNPVRRRAMSDKAFSAWKQKFTWAQIAREYARVYQSVLSGNVA